MDEKLSGVYNAPAARQPRRALNPAVKVAVALSALMLLTLTWIPAQLPASLRTHRCHHHNDQLRYAGEKIAWTACGDVAGRPVECSSIDVPMDHFNATNSGDKTFSVPLIRMRGKNATQNLLLNPGGW
jgi:hypothetical protein